MDRNRNRNPNNSLAHYGIKGMRWGVTRTDAQIAKAEAKRKAETHEDAATANAAKSKIKSSGTDALSNKELQGLVNRMNLEQQYSKLSGSSQSKTKQTGKKFVTDVLVNSAKTTTQNAVSNAMKKGLEAAIKSAVGS